MEIDNIEAPLENKKQQALKQLQKTREFLRIEEAFVEELCSHAEKNISHDQEIMSFVKVMVEKIADRIIYNNSNKIELIVDKHDIENLIKEHNFMKKQYMIDILDSACNAYEDVDGLSVINNDNAGIIIRIKNS